jgi:hypothetical protein
MGGPGPAARSPTGGVPTGTNGSQGSPRPPRSIQPGIAEHSAASSRSGAQKPAIG